jgi:hypothetical protein
MIDIGEESLTLISNKDAGHINPEALKGAARAWGGESWKELNRRQIDQAAKAIARKFRWSILPYGNLAANRLGLSLQVPAKFIYLSNGPAKDITIGNTTIQFKHARPKEIYADSYIFGLVVQSLRYFGRGNISDEIIAHLQQNLSVEEKKELLKNIPFSAEWIYEIVQKIAKD